MTSVFTINGIKMSKKPILKSNLTQLIICNTVSYFSALNLFYRILVQVRQQSIYEH